MKKRYFTKEFKLNAVSLAQERENIADGYTIFDWRVRKDTAAKITLVI